MNKKLYNVITPNGGNLENVDETNGVVFSIFEEMKEQGIKKTSLEIAKPKTISILYSDFSDDYIIERVK